MPDLHHKKLALQAICEFFTHEVACKDLTMETTISEFFSRLNYDAPLFDDADHRFENISDIEPEFGKYILAAEARDVCYWGVDLGTLDQSDALVYRGGYLIDKEEEKALENGDESPNVPFIWGDYGDSIFQFLAVSLFWNAVNGGWKFSGMSKLKKVEIAALKRSVRSIDIGRNKSELDLYALGKDSIIAVDVSREVFAAARTSEDWERLVAVVPRLDFYDD